MLLHKTLIFLFETLFCCAHLSPDRVPVYLNPQADPAKLFTPVCPESPAETGAPQDPENLPGLWKDLREMLTHTRGQVSNAGAAEAARWLCRDAPLGCKNSHLK